MSEKVYVFEISVHVTLDDEDDDGNKYYFPKQLSKEFKNVLISELNETKYTNDMFMDALQEKVSCNLKSVHLTE